VIALRNRCMAAHTPARFPNMDSISAGLLRFDHLLTQARKVGSKDRWSEFHGFVLH